MTKPIAFILLIGIVTLASQKLVPIITIKTGMPEGPVTLVTFLVFLWIMILSVNIIKKPGDNQIVIEPFDELLADTTVYFQMLGSVNGFSVIGCNTLGKSFSMRYFLFSANLLHHPVGFEGWGKIISNPGTGVNRFNITNVTHERPTI